MPLPVGEQNEDNDLGGYGGNWKGGGGLGLGQGGAANIFGGGSGGGPGLSHGALMDPGLISRYLRKRYANPGSLLAGGGSFTDAEHSPYAGANILSSGGGGGAAVAGAGGGGPSAAGGWRGLVDRYLPHPGWSGTVGDARGPGQSQGGVFDQNGRSPQGLSFDQLMERWQKGIGGKEDALRLALMIASGSGTGAFSLYGDPKMMEALAQKSRMEGNARVRSAELEGDLRSGGDPSLLAYNRLMARSGVEDSVGQSVNDAYLQSLMRGQDLATGIHQMLLGYELNQGNIERQGWWNQKAAGAGRQGTDWAGLAGTLGGAAIGAFG